MVTATQRNVRFFTRDIRERMDVSNSRVDRGKCVIYGVKVLGRSSPNRHGLDVQGTDYTPEAHEKARDLYEGVAVNIGHPPRNDPDAERDPDDRNGTLFNVRVQEGQTYADWQLIPSHPMTRRILDCAENPRLHGQFALSHNAKGYGSVVEGRYRITEIPRVRSVDLVCEGGTNSSLFEGRETMPDLKPFKQHVAAASKEIQKRFANLLEADDFYGEMPTEAPEESGDDAGHEGHLAEMVKAIILSAEMSAEDKLEKIKLALKIIGGEEKPDESANEGETAVKDTEEAEDAEEETPDKNDKMESRDVRDLERLRREEKVRNLCESKQFIPTALQVKALAGLTSDQDRKEMIAVFQSQTSPGKKYPQTGGARNVQESRDKKGSKKSDFLAAVKR